MSDRDRIRQIEEYVKRVSNHAATPDLKLAHGFGHADRVRHWALRIARGEAFEDLMLVEACALLHDIGLTTVTDRRHHAQVGATIAAQFLSERNLLDDESIDAITRAIACHNSLDGGGLLGGILRDADMLDAVGAVGLMRAFTSKYALPEYDPENVKGQTWGMTGRDFDQRFAAGDGIGPYIVDQVNFQISFFDNLNTRTAKALAAPLVTFMKGFLRQIEAEVTGQIKVGSG